MPSWVVMHNRRNVALTAARRAVRMVGADGMGRAATTSITRA
jgi:hypothetical protein